MNYNDVECTCGCHHFKLLVDNTGVVMTMCMTCNKVVNIVDLKKPYVK